MTIAASQKGLMTPAGVSFNFVNDKALARRKALRRRVSSYWDWVPRIEIPLGFCAQLLPLPFDDLAGEALFGWLTDRPWRAQTSALRGRCPRTTCTAWRPRSR